MDIEALEARVKEATAVLDSASKELHAAQVVAAPVAVGDVVRTRRYGLIRVTKVHVRWSPPWVEGNSKNKNGEWSKAVRHLYNDWTLIMGGDDVPSG